MGAVWVRVRAELRSSWKAWLVVALLVCVLLILLGAFGGR